MLRGCHFLVAWDPHRRYRVEETFNAYSCRVSRGRASNGKVARVQRDATGTGTGTGTKRDGTRSDATPIGIPCDQDPRHLQGFLEYVDQRQ